MEPWGTPARIYSKPNLKHTRLARQLMVKMVNSDVLFDTGKQQYLYETMVNLTISVPNTKSWYSRSLNVLSGFKRWPAELALSRPLPPTFSPFAVWQCLCLYVTYTLQSSMVWYPWFTLNITKQMTTIRRKNTPTCEMGILCFHRYNYVDL